MEGEGGREMEGERERCNTFIYYTYTYTLIHESSEGLSSITNPKPRGSHPSTCSVYTGSCFEHKINLVLIYM